MNIGERLADFEKRIALLEKRDVEVYRKILEELATAREHHQLLAEAILKRMTRLEMQLALSPHLGKSS